MTSPAARVSPRGRKNRSSPFLRIIAVVNVGPEFTPSDSFRIDAHRDRDALDDEG